MPRFLLSLLLMFFSLSAFGQSAPKSSNQPAKSEAKSVLTPSPLPQKTKTEPPKEVLPESQPDATSATPNQLTVLRESLSKETHNESWDNELIVSIVNCLIAVLNFAFVIFIFIAQKKDRKEDRIAGINSFWFQEYFLAPNKETIVKCFNGISDKIEAMSNQPGSVQAQKKLQIKQLMREIKQSKNDLAQNTVEEIGVMNQELSKELTKMLNAFEDQLANKVNEAFRTGNFTPMLSIVGFTKREFVTRLYKAHHEFICPVKS